MDTEGKDLLKKRGVLFLKFIIMILVVIVVAVTVSNIVSYVMQNLLK